MNDEYCEVCGSNEDKLHWDGVWFVCNRCMRYSKNKAKASKTRKFQKMFLDELENEWSNDKETTD